MLRLKGLTPPPSLSFVAQSILNDEKGWKPSVTVKQILSGIQELLDSPNNKDAAQEPAWRLFGSNQAKYILRVKEEVKKYVPAGDAGATVL
jgi:ubiquitin-conjugating enzyme E2 I